MPLLPRLESRGVLAGLADYLLVAQALSPAHHLISESLTRAAFEARNLLLGRPTGRQNHATAQGRVAAHEANALARIDRKRKDDINSDARLSHRQKELLVNMITNPTARTDIGAYAHRFECAASTARDDLNRLVDLRYCSAAYQGKKQVFWLNEARWL